MQTKIEFERLMYIYREREAHFFQPKSAVSSIKLRLRSKVENVYNKSSKHVTLLGETQDQEDKERKIKLFYHLESQVDNPKH